MIQFLGWFIVWVVDCLVCRLGGCLVYGFG